MKSKVVSPVWKLNKEANTVPEEARSTEKKVTYPCQSKQAGKSCSSLAKLMLNVEKLTGSINPWHLQLKVLGWKVMERTLA